MTDTTTTEKQPEPQASAEAKPEAQAAAEKASATKASTETNPAKPAEPKADTAQEPAAPAAPVEKPFNIDVLQSCTARFTHKAWALYSKYKADLNVIQTVPVRASLTARTPEGAQEILKLLKEAGVSELTHKQKVIEFSATFAQIQAVIKHPQTHMLDAVKI